MQGSPEVQPDIRGMRQMQEWELDDGQRSGPG